LNSTSAATRELRIFDFTQIQKFKGDHGMKTLKEFDYDLWAIEENGRKRYFARIKATGEETEVSLEVMRLLLSQEKQMRREYAKQQTIGPVLSLDAIRDGGSMDEAAWLLDTRQRIDSEVLTAELTDAFCKTLTDSQRSIFRECLIEGKSQTAYAAEHGISVPMVNKQIRAIRGKAKIYFS
jgi:hypothetical protein